MQCIYPHLELIHDHSNNQYLILAQNIFHYSRISDNKMQSLVNKSLILVLGKGWFFGGAANVVQIF